MNVPSYKNISHVLVKYSAGRQPTNRLVNQGWQIAFGLMPISTRSFFATWASFTSSALENSALSTSIWIDPDEKYGRIWVSMIEMKIQNASSSGARRRS